MRIIILLCLAVIAGCTDTVTAPPSPYTPVLGAGPDDRRVIVAYVGNCTTAIDVTISALDQQGNATRIGRYEQFSSARFTIPSWVRSVKAEAVGGGRSSTTKRSTTDSVTTVPISCL